MGCRGPYLAADAMTGAERSYVTPLGLHDLAAILLISTQKDRPGQIFWLESVWTSAGTLP